MSSSLLSSRVRSQPVSTPTRASGRVLAAFALLSLTASCTRDEVTTPQSSCAGSTCDAGNERPVDGQVPTPPPRDGAVDNPTPNGPSEPLAGCTPRREAIALYPGAQLVDNPPADAPFTCSNLTGHEAPFNTSIAVDEDGALLFGPALATGVVRSNDNGATWQGPVNQGPHPLAGNWGHPWLWRDPDSGRMFYTTYNSFMGPCLLGTGHNYWYSDDGVNWTTVEGGVGCNSWDWGKIVTGPAALPASKQALEKNGYPNVVYFCAGGPTYAIGPNHFCYRSLDGGKTFTRTKGDAIDPLRGQVGWPNAGTVAPDGRFYKAHPSSSGLRLSVTADEGDTWKAITIPDTNFGGDANSLNFLSSNVTHDADGTLYVAWIDDKDLNPYLRYSKDAGQTWSTPLMLGAPGVKAASCVNVSIKRPGYVAVTYYGSKQAEGKGNGHTTNDGRPYDAYLTVSTNVFADKPLFWSTTINDPSTPAINGIDLLVAEYIGAPAFGPDGSIWVGVLMHPEGLVGRMTAPPDSSVD